MSSPRRAEPVTLVHWQKERRAHGQGEAPEDSSLQVLKALAEYHDMTLGDLLEGIVLHAFDGKAPFGDDTLRRIAELKKVYDLDLDSGAAHRLIERERLSKSARSARSPSATPPPEAAARAPRRPPSAGGR